MMLSSSKSKNKTGSSGEPFVCFVLLVSLLFHALRCDGEQRAMEMLLTVLLTCLLTAYVFWNKFRSRRQSC